MIPTSSTPVSAIGRPSSSRGASALSHHSDIRSNSPAVSEPSTGSKSTFTVFSVFDVPPVRKAAGGAGGNNAVVTYSKEVQTSPYDDKGYGEDDYGEEEVVYKGSELDLLRNSIRQEIESEMARASRRKDNVTQQHQQQQDGDDNDKQVIDNIEITLAEDSELGQLATDPEFDRFLDQSLKVVGRAVAATHRYDITVDYSTIADGNMAAQLGDRRRPVVELTQFYSAHSAGRAVTALDWSPHFPELLASAHTEKRGDPHAPKGLVQIWNLNGSFTQPEYVFTAASDVLAVKFSQFDTHIVFGTCYNGQVLTWDLRRLRRGAGEMKISGEAVLASPVNGRGHAHPVYSVEVTGTQNAHNLVSASTDGLVCTWTPDLLEQPQDKLVLTAPPLVMGLSGGTAGVTSSGSSSSALTTAGARNEEIAPTRMAISPRDSSRFVVGTEEGALYQCSRFGQAGSRAGVDPRGVYRAHAAPVTALEFHSPRGAVDFSDLLLSSSLDWSVKLWKIRPFTGPLAAGGLGGKADFNSLEPLLDLVRDHEVYDVAWSGFHPAVFASVDGSGHLELWDLARDIEVPIARIKPSSSSLTELGGPASAAVGGGPKLAINTDNYLERPLNRVAWEKAVMEAPVVPSAASGAEEEPHSSSSAVSGSNGAGGRRIVVGGLDGRVTVFELDAEVFASPRPADWVQLEKQIAQLERAGGASTLF